MGPEVTNNSLKLTHKLNYLRLKQNLRGGKITRLCLRSLSFCNKLLANENKIKEDEMVNENKTAKGPTLESQENVKDKEIIENKDDDARKPTEEVREKPKKRIIDTTKVWDKKVPSAWDKQILMYGSRYDSVEDIPQEVRLPLLNGTYDRVRVYFGLYSILSLVVLLFTIMYLGKKDIKKREEFDLKMSDGLWEAAEKKYAGQKIERKTKS